MLPRAFILFLKQESVGLAGMGEARVLLEVSWLMASFVFLHAMLVFAFYFILFYFIFLLFFRASMAHGGSQARGWIRALAATLYYSHSNVGSELHLRLTPQLTAMPARSLARWARPGIEPAYSWMPISFVNHWAMMGNPSIVFNMQQMDVFQKAIYNRLNALLHIHRMKH